MFFLSTCMRGFYHIFKQPVVWDLPRDPSPDVNRREDDPPRPDRCHPERQTDANPPQVADEPADPPGVRAPGNQALPDEDRQVEEVPEEIEGHSR